MTAGPMILGFTVLRFRWLFIVTIAYMLVLAVIGQIPETVIPPWVGAVLTVPFFGIMFATIFSFVNIEADFASTASGYHPFLLRLPIRTSALVLWPTVAVTVWSFGSWVWLCALFFHPRGVTMPMIWPAAMFAALALCLQSILWPPVQIGGLRLAVALIFPTLVVLFGLFAASFGWQEDRISYVYLIVALGSLGLAWYGVDRARTAPPGRIARTIDFREAAERESNRKVAPAFRSRVQAQFWLEWRRQGRILPIATAIVLGLFTLPLPFNRELVDENAFGHAFSVNVFVWPMLPVLPWIPLLMATAIGMLARRSDMRGSDGVYHLYYATRPLDEEEIYRAKLRALSLGVVVTIGITLAFLALWLSQPARWNGKELPFWAVLSQILTKDDFELFGAIALVIGAWMWRNQAVGAFVDYITSRFVSLMYPLFVTVAGVAWLVIVSLNSQFVQSDRGRITMAAVLSVVLAAKLGLTFWYGRQLLQLRPDGKRILAWSFAQWIVWAVISACSLYWVAVKFDGGPNPPYFVRMPIPILVGLLIVPLARPTIARWALQTGRHR